MKSQKLFVVVCFFLAAFGQTARAEYPDNIDMTYDAFKAWGNFTGLAQAMATLNPRGKRRTPPRFGYGTQKSRADITAAVTRMLSVQKTKDIPAAAIQSQLKTLFKMNNEAYLKFLGYDTGDVSNGMAMARFWNSRHVAALPAAVKSEADTKAAYDRAVLQKQAGQIGAEELDKASLAYGSAIRNRIKLSAMAGASGELAAGR